MISVYLYEGDGELVPEWVALRLARLPRSRPAPPLRRPGRPRARRRAPGRLRRRGLACVVLPAGASTRPRCRSPRRAGSSSSRTRSRSSGASGSARATRRAGRSGSRSSTSPAATASRSGPASRTTGRRCVIDETTPWVQQVPRPLGPVRPRPDLGRERAGRPDVRPRRTRPPLLVRPARVRRPRPGHPAAAGARTSSRPSSSASSAAQDELDREIDERPRRRSARSARASRACGAARTSPPPRRGSRREAAELAASLTGLRRERPRTSPWSRGSDAGIAALDGGRRADDPRAHIRHAAAPVPAVEAALRPRGRGVGGDLDQPPARRPRRPARRLARERLGRGDRARAGLRRRASRSCAGRSSARSTGSA